MKMNWVNSKSHNIGVKQSKLDQHKTFQAPPFPPYVGVAVRGGGSTNNRKQHGLYAIPSLFSEFSLSKSGGKVVPGLSGSESSLWGTLLRTSSAASSAVPLLAVARNCSYSVLACTTPWRQDNLHVTACCCSQDCRWGWRRRSTLSIGGLHRWSLVIECTKPTKYTVG